MHLPSTLELFLADISFVFLLKHYILLLSLCTDDVRGWITDISVTIGVISSLFGLLLCSSS